MTAAACGRVMVLLLLLLLLLLQFHTLSSTGANELLFWNMDNPSRPRLQVLARARSCVHVRVSALARVCTLALEPSRPSPKSNAGGAAWASHTVLLGWDVIGEYLLRVTVHCPMHKCNILHPPSLCCSGIWPSGSDGTDVNACAVNSSRTLLCTTDDLGFVKLFRCGGSSSSSSNSNSSSSICGGRCSLCIH